MRSTLDHKKSGEHLQPPLVLYFLVLSQGQRKAKRVGEGETGKKAARQAAAKLQARLALGGSLHDETTTPTVRAYTESWQKTYVEVHCKPSTVKDYRTALTRHVLPVLGDRRLHEVTRVAIKQLIADLSAKGLKKQTIHNILTPLKEAYHHAMDDGIVGSNPVARTGRLTRTREDRRIHIAPLTGDEVHTLLSKASVQRLQYLYPLLLCAVRTGLRQGELIGLQWGDVDLRSGFVEVRRAIVRGEVSTPKSHKIRRVDLSPQLADTLERLKETRQLDAAMNNRKPMPEWVFLSSHGCRWDEGNLRKTFYYCMDQAGIRKVRFHDLRHTWVSLLIEAGAHPKYIQEQAGHSSIQVTMDIYGHLFPTGNRGLVTRLDDAPIKVENATSVQPVG